VTKEFIIAERDRYAEELRQAGARVLQLQGAVAACNTLLALEERENERRRNERPTESETNTELQHPSGNGDAVDRLPHLRVHDTPTGERETLSDGEAGVPSVQ